jgi:hypothetical protein
MKAAHTVRGMDMADRVLGAATPGSVTMVVGRPASGVSRLLAGVATRAGMLSGLGAVLASWERAAVETAKVVAVDEVAVPEIIGWSVDELGACRELAGAPSGTVVCLDYLQLLGAPVPVATALRALAKKKGWTLAVGVFAPRCLSRLDGDLRGAAAISEVESLLGEVVSQADWLVVLSSGQHPSASLGRRGSSGQWSLVATEPL